MKNLPLLGLSEALAAAEAIRDELARRGKTAVIAVADAHGELLVLLRLDGAPLSSIGVATNKAFTAARMQRATRALGQRIRDHGTDIAFYGDPRYVGFGGGMPVTIDGVVAGSVAVSGLTDTEDEEVAALGIEALLRRRAQG